MRTSHYGELNSIYEREETRGGRAFFVAFFTLAALIYSLVFVVLIEFVTGEKHFSLSLSVLLHSECPTLAARGQYSPSIAIVCPQALFNVAFNR